MFNKKIFCAILIGAFTIASTSTFVSCKDYDDDINDVRNELQGQIDKLALKTDVDALKAKLAEVEADAKTYATKAELALVEATADNAATKAALAEVKAVADQAAADVVSAVAKAEAAASAAVAAQSTADAANEAAGNAQSTADAANAAAGNAQSTADAAKLAAANAAEAAAAAKTKADQAVADAAAAAAAAAEAKGLFDSAAKKSDFEAALVRIGKLEVDIATANALAGRVATLETQIASLQGVAGQTITYNVYKINEETGEVEVTEESGTIDAALKACQSRVAAISAGVEAIWSAITSVNLFANTHEGPNNVSNRFDHILSFLFAIEQDDVKFPADAAVADKQFTFKKDYRPTYADSVLIRVMPVNAKFDVEDIVLINSKGEDLLKSNLIEQVTVEPFNRIITRADVATGLWVVKFKVKDNFNKDEAAEKEFRDAAILRENGRDASILYAIGIRSGKDSDDKSRYVVSEYDMTLFSAEATHVYDFTVNDKSINRIHNRYHWCDDGTNTETVAELNWINDPATKVITSGAEKNAEDRYMDIDDRQGQEILSVVKGEPITISFDVENQPTMKIRGFYVTLDQEFALESQPSEINAWVSYTYTGGVGYTKPGTDEIVKAELHEGNVATISVEDMGNVVGDIIGFRVYAVNLDGTLTDPDGRAFYVKIGNEVDKTQKIGDVTIVATKQFGASSEAVNIQNVKFNADVRRWELVWDDENPDIYYGTAANSWNSPIADTQEAYYTPTSAKTNFLGTYYFDIVFKDADGNDITFANLATATQSGKALKNVVVTIPEHNSDARYYGAAGLLDNKVYKLVLKGYKDDAGISDEVLQTIAINVKKTLPTSLPDVKVKAGQVANQTYRMKPYLHSINPIWNWSNSYYMESDGTVVALTAGVPAHAWDVRFAPVSRYYIGYETYNFADIYSLINPETGDNVLDQNYYFEFEEGGLQKHDIKDVVPAVIAYNSNGIYNVANFTDNTYGSRANNAIAYTLPMIQRGIVSVAGVQRDVKVGYTYQNISLKKNENNIAIMDDVKVDAKNKFKYTYKSAFDLKNIKSTNTNPETLTYATLTVLNADKIQYKGAATDAWFELPASGTTLANLISGYYITVVEGSATMTGLEDYFVMDFDYTNVTATFRPIMDTQDHHITADVTGSYSFDIQDVMGNKQTITISLKMPKP